MKVPEAQEGHYTELSGGRSTDEKRGNTQDLKKMFKSLTKVPFLV